MRGLFLVSENVPNVRMIYKEDRDRIAAELTEAADALEAGPWMPIETAPKDGTPVLLWFPCELGAWNPGGWRGAWSHVDDQWVIHTPMKTPDGRAIVASRIPQQPTQWMPLPAAPAAQVAQEGGGVATDGGGHA